MAVTPRLRSKAGSGGLEREASMNQNSSGEKVYRIALTDEQLNWIGSALRSYAQSGSTRKTTTAPKLRKLAARLMERHAGNPNLILQGQLTTEEAN